MRSRDEIARRHLFERMLSFVHGAAVGQERSDRAVELISLPFSLEEEEWFEDYLLGGAGSTFHGAKDTVLIRRIVTGRAHEARSLGQSIKERKIDGLNWTNLTHGMNQEPI